jgi:Na(+)-translocating NADH:ubiquinone oxidoreductase A subunit
MIKIKRGLNLPIAGEPEQTTAESKDVERVAVLGPDYVGVRPTMAVRVADNVKKGQVLFTDKKIPAVKYTAPAAGRVVQINRGAKRALQSVVIQLSGDSEVTFPITTESKLGMLKREQVIEQLVESGLWTALRTRPYSKTPDPQTVPHSIFILWHRILQKFCKVMKEISATALNSSPNLLTVKSISANLLKLSFRMSILTRLWSPILSGHTRQVMSVRIFIFWILFTG